MATAQIDICGFEQKDAERIREKIRQILCGNRHWKNAFFLIPEDRTLFPGVEPPKFIRFIGPFEHFRSLFALIPKMGIFTVYFEMSCCDQKRA